MLFVELPLSISTQWILNSSILSIITCGSSWGCLTPQASISEKTMSDSLHLGIFEGENREWTLFTSLVYAFFSDLEDPPTTNPLKIILISPMRAFLPLVSSSLFFSSLCCHLYDSNLQTSIISLDELGFLLGISDVCIRQCDAHGPGGIYSTCFCLLLLLKHKLVWAIIERVHPLSPSVLAQLASVEEWS